MCGIAGIYGQTLNRKEKLNKMLSNLYHRGPDEKGHFIDDNYCSGIRRLSINDIDGGSQPLFNKDKTVVIVYNGEIYNYKILRKNLEKKGYAFKTNSDGEVIAHLYDEIGEQVFDYLDGMFAISIWDTKLKILLIARDSAGEKPLYYLSDNNASLIFSSEIRAIEQSFPEKLSINNQSIWDFPTFLWVPEPYTIYKQIKTLTKGKYLKLSPNGMSFHDIDCNFIAEDFDAKFDSDPITFTRKIVEESITSRLLSDVPIGCFLSGGLDSSIVSIIASKNIENLSTFNIAFENIKDPYHGTADESEEAEATAKLINSNHYKIFVNEKTFYDDLRNFSYYGDQPFAVSSGLGILSISRAAKNEGIKVLLSGDGADECFGGYSWYNYLKSICMKGSDNKIDKNIISFQNHTTDKEYLINQIRSLSVEEKAYSLHYYAHEEEKNNLFNPDFTQKVDHSSLRYFHDINIETPEKFIKHDREFYFPNEMLCKVDRMTMANSIEGRAPFASANILELSKKLNIDQMINHGNLKWILREAFKDILPSDVLNRKKHGFNVPIDHWIKNKWNDLAMHSFSSESKLFKNGFIHKKTIDYAKKLINDESRLSGHSIFSFIMLNLWMEERYGNNS